jgi:hypothetical protein
MVAPTEPSEQAQEAANPQMAAGEQPGSEQAPSLTHLVADLRTAAAEFGEYAKYLASVQVDRARHLAKQATFFGVLGVVGLLVFSGFLITGASLFVIGVAGLLGSVFNNFWVGAAIVGLLIIALPPLGVYIAWKIFSARAIHGLKAKYADIRQQHKQAFGRDIEEVSRG